MSISEPKKKILGYIRDGRNTLAAFTDNLGLPAPRVNQMAEELEQEGYVVHKGFIGIERFNWLLTDKGAAELDPLSEEESKLLEAGINLNQFRILSYTVQHPGALAGEICDKVKIPGGEMVSNLSYLVDNGYVTDSGLIRRRNSVTDKGAEVVKKFSGQIKV